MREINPNIPSRQRQQAFGATPEWFMLTMSKITSYSTFAFLFCFQLSKVAFATELLLNVPGNSVRIVTDGAKVTAKGEDQKTSYIVSDSFANHLKKTFEVKLINTYGDARHPIFFILTREPSRPASMGRGYCGAGYEDYLLLVKLDKKTFTLTDNFLLQSCLQTKSMRIEQSDLKPQDALRINTDGSYNFEMIEDQYGEIWNLKVSQGRFIIKNISEKIP